MEGKNTNKGAIYVIVILIAIAIFIKFPFILVVLFFLIMTGKINIGKIIKKLDIIHEIKGGSFKLREDYKKA